MKPEDYRDPECKAHHPDQRMLKGWVPCWPWRCYACEGCDYVVVDWNPVQQFLWDVLVSWWWDGRLKLEKSKNTKGYWAD